MNYQYLLRQPYHLFVITGVIFTCLSFFATDRLADFHLSDTYFVITVRSLILLAGILMIVLWLLCQLTHHFLFSARLGWIHFILTFITLLVFMASLFIPNFSENLTPRRYYNFDKTPGLSSSVTWAWITAIAIIIFIIAQVIYLVNFTVGIVSKLIKSN